MFTRLPVLAFLSLAPVLLLAADVETDWKVVTDLDAGPRVKPSTQQEARSAAVGHLAAQEKALRGFLAAHAKDAHAFEAQIRLARVLQMRAGLENSEAPRNEARRILEELNSTATAEQRVEVDFALITFQMRVLNASSGKEREQLLSATRRFQAEHASDRRLPLLLAEVATLFDNDAETKRSLLLSALQGAQDEELKARLGDDLRRLEWLGKPLPLRFTTSQGKTVDLEESRGKIVLLLFFADWSPPSIDAIARVQRSLKDLPKEKVQVYGISLDNKAESLAVAINKYSIGFPVGFDGKGWASPTVRTLGINTLPTVWLIDQVGVLRSLNALDGTTDQVMNLVRKPPTR